MSEIAASTRKRSETKGEVSVSRIKKADVSQSIHSPVDQVLYLQRTIGNRAVQQLIRSGTLQAKRRIGQPGDIYEQEADRVADTVMRMQTPQPITGSDLRIQRIYPACEEEVQMQPMEEKEELQGKATSGHISDANPDLESHIQSLEGGGHPLSENDPTFFEPRFGQGFSPVRLHTDGAAASGGRAGRRNISDKTAC